MNDRNGEIELDLLRLWKALWHRLWAIVLAAAVFCMGALGYTQLCIEPLYKAKVLMYVNSSDISVGGTKLSISEAELSAAQSLVDTYIVILNTRTTLQDVIEEAGVSYTYEELMSREMIRAAAVNGTEVFAVEVTSTDPEEAALLANTIARVLPGKIASIVEGSSARIVDYAVVPTGKASPNVSKNMLIGAVAGGILASLAVVILELMDDQIHDPDYLSRTYDIPVLAVIPDLRYSQSGGESRHTAGTEKKTR